MRYLQSFQLMSFVILNNKTTCLHWSKNQLSWTNNQQLLSGKNCLKRKAKGNQQRNIPEKYNSPQKEN